MRPSIQTIRQRLRASKQFFGVVALEYTGHVPALKNNKRISKYEYEAESGETITRPTLINSKEVKNYLTKLRSELPVQLADYNHDGDKEAFFGANTPVCLFVDFWFERWGEFHARADLDNALTFVQETLMSKRRNKQGIANLVWDDRQVHSSVSRLHIVPVDVLERAIAYVWMPDLNRMDEELAKFLMYRTEFLYKPEQEYPDWHKPLDIDFDLQLD